MLPKSRFSTPIFGHSAGSTKLDRPYCETVLNKFQESHTPTPRFFVWNSQDLRSSLPHTEPEILEFQKVHFEVPTNALFWRQIWRVAERESDSPELLESPRTSPEVPQTSPEVFRRLPRKFSHCGTYQQSRGSPEVSQTSPELPRTSPEVSRTSPEVSPFLWAPDTLS